MHANIGVKMTQESYCFRPSCLYRMVGKFGGNLIWQIVCEFKLVDFGWSRELHV